MNMKEYKAALDSFLEENPAAMDYLVITSSDDEGNSFTSVCYSPSVGQFEDGEFNAGRGFTDNAVCLN